MLELCFKVILKEVKNCLLLAYYIARSRGNSKLPTTRSKFASKLHVHSVNYVAKLVHTRRALSSTIINSH